MRALILALLLLLPTPTWDMPVPQVVRNVVVPHTDDQCIANAVRYEAIGEPLVGQRAVYEVIMHRVRKAHSSPCKVVKAPGQFSWYGHKPILPLTKPMKDMLKRLRHHPRVLDSKFRWFFSGRIPKWASDMECRQIGNHRFCREVEQQDE